MRLLIVMLILTVLSAPAAELKGNTATFSEEELKLCTAEGGCMYTTKDRFDSEMRRAFEAGRKSKVCPGRDI